MRRASVLLAIGLVLLAGCRGATPRCCTPLSVSADAEALAGARVAPVVEARYGGVVRDFVAEQRMHRIGFRLTQHTSEIQGPCHYRVLNTNKPNAVSLPGGRVYITRGLYARLESDELLAAALAHELAHIASKDHFKPRCACVEDALDRETSADCRGAEYLLKAGLGPNAMIEVVRLIEDAQPTGWADVRVRLLMRKISRTDKSNIVARN